jgi:radical SAM superfamily enzyme YgiQ (UPF0313 family)
MATTLHLHASFPYLLEIPNAALGYLKSALAEQPVDVTNVYWYLPPKEILEPLSSIYARFQDRYIDIFEMPTVFTVYLSRFLYEGEKGVHTPTAGESLIGSYTMQQKVKKIALHFKDFVDYSLETEKMADVDVAGFTVNFYQWVTARYIWSQLKALNPNIQVVVGGLATRGDAEAFMGIFGNVDYALWGEGEIPLRALMSCIDDEKALSDVPRLVYREKGEIKATDVAGEFRLDPLPFADHTEYFEQMKTFDLNISPAIPILSVRSCRWNKCKFCGVNKGGSYYERSTKDIVDEIEYQSKKYAVDKVVFLDTDFGRRRDADFKALLTALLQSVDRRKKPYHVWATLSPTVLNRRYAEMMSKIRIHIQIGFEALTDYLLGAMNKMHRFAENIQALKLGMDYGLDISGSNVIRNLPEERKEDVIESMENLKVLRFFLSCYELTPSVLSLYKGTPYYAETPPEERETKWVVNMLCEEMDRVNLVEGDSRWDLFGFRAETLDHHLLWDQFTSLLEDYQTATISYSWLEFSDGSSFIEEHNNISGNKTYLLTEVETNILKYCDSIVSTEKLKKEVHAESESVIESAISQLEAVNLLYGDERGRLISVVSAKNLRKIDEG